MARKKYVTVWALEQTLRGAPGAEKEAETEAEAEAKKETEKEAREERRDHLSAETTSSALHTHITHAKMFSHSAYLGDVPFADVSVPQTRRVERSIHVGHLPNIPLSQGTGECLRILEKECHVCHGGRYPRGYVSVEEFRLRHAAGRATSA